MSKQTSRRAQRLGRSAIGWLAVLGALATSPIGCQSGEMPLSARIDPLRATEADM
jgi:hypothetical protein